MTHYKPLTLEELLKEQEKVKEQLKDETRPAKHRDLLWELYRELYLRIEAAKQEDKRV